MLLVREVFHCKPGKVRPMVKMFLEGARLNEEAGLGKSRVLTDFCGDRYWTVISEYEVPSMDVFERMMRGEGMPPEVAQKFEKIMQGYHELVDHGHREIYKIEESAP